MPRVNQAPRVTVCIPTYARPQWLGPAIESVLAQTFTGFRLEVHDDATPGPEVREVVARYDDPRLTLVEHSENAGIVGNFSRSLLAAQSEYVIQLGDDDEMHPQLLEATVAALDRHPSAGLAHTRFDLVDDSGAVRHGDVDWTGDGAPELETGAAFVRASMLHGCRVCSSTALIRRAAVPPGAFRAEDFPPFDFGCWMRMAQMWDFAFVPRPLCRYRVHGLSHSSRVSDVVGGGYVQRLETVQAVHAVKLRAAAGDRQLTRLARRGRARNLAARVRTETVPERRLRPTLRALAGSARIEPALLLDREAWMLLAGSVAGRRLAQRLRGS
jgi:glycosyltransferase involved in cell wall biosynthesis